MSNLASPGNTLDREVVAALQGKCVDEFGNILDRNGTVLGRVEGDLPSMIGRPVCEDGKVLDTAGDVAGHVSETWLDAAEEKHAENNRKRLKVDDDGTIYDHNGAAVGRMKNNTASDAPRPPGGRESCKFCGSRKDDADKSGGEANEANEAKEANGETSQSTVTPSPSEIYLDVKSTHDGIRLIIKIPTVINGGGHETWKCTMERAD